MEQFEIQAKQAAAGLVNVLTAITPIFLISAIIGVAVFNGWLEYLHYAAVIGSLAWIPGFIFAGMRFGSGLGGIHMFKSGQAMRGIFFLSVSVGLTFWTSAHAPAMAKSIAVSALQIENAEWFVRTALWVALLGELMIATYMGAHANETKRNDATKDESNAATVKFQVAQPTTATPQRNGMSADRNGNIYNETKRNTIGFQMPQPSAKPVSNEVSPQSVKDDGYLVADELQRAKNNLRAYESKLRNNNGNPETLRKGVAKWTAIVAELETKLQD